MEKKSKIFIAGHQGLVGASIVRTLQIRGYKNLIYRTSKELDLRQQKDVELFFAEEQPEYVVLAAAKVGGIMANMTYPAEFLYDNLMIQNNIINSAYKNGTKKLLFLASSCIYPREAPQPMKEEYLLTGQVEPTNEGYAIAKIAGLKLCEMYNRQYGTDYISVMPCNIYGIGDNFNSIHSHVVPALISKFYEAKICSSPYVEVWGTGKARRELLYTDDLADACIYLMDTYSGNEFFNIGMGEDVSIEELAKTIKDVVGYEGDIKFDITKPDGMPQKLMDVGKMAATGWTHKTSLCDGLKLTYQWYLENYELYNNGEKRNE
ncbi:MAG: GDP-L-fucose synthase family protein [Mobilitalea sp.]